MWPGLLPAVLRVSLNQQTSASEDVEKGDPCALLVGMQISAATVEFPQNIKNGIAF